MLYANPLLVDNGPNYLLTNGETVHIIETPSTNYAAVVADSIMSYDASLTLGDRTGGGREATLAAESDIAVSFVGTTKEATHYVIVDDTNSTVLFVGEADSKTYNSTGDTANIASYKIYQIGAPENV